MTSAESVPPILVELCVQPHYIEAILNHYSGHRAALAGVCTNVPSTSPRCALPCKSGPTTLIGSLRGGEGSRHTLLPILVAPPSRPERIFQIAIRGPLSAIIC